MHFTFTTLASLRVEFTFSTDWILYSILSTGILNNGTWIHSNIHGARILNDARFPSTFIKCFWDRNLGCFLPFPMFKPPPTSSLMLTSKLLEEISVSRLCVFLWFFVLLTIVWITSLCVIHPHLVPECFSYRPFTWTIKAYLASVMLENCCKLQKLLAKLLMLNSWGHFEKYR